MEIHISLRLFANLSERMPENHDRFAVSSGTTVGKVLSSLGVTEEEARLVFINNRQAVLTTVLQAGDRLGVFPPVGGG